MKLHAICRLALQHKKSLLVALGVLVVLVGLFKSNYDRQQRALVARTLRVVETLNPNRGASDAFEPGRKYLMVRCDKEDEANMDCGGWGDRLKSIFTGFWIALLTNRTFVLRINRPCELTDIYEPNEVNWNIDVPLSGKINITSKIVKRMNTEEYKAELRWSKGLDDFTSDEQLIILVTNRNLLETISQNRNPFFRNQFRYLGFDSDDDYSKVQLQYSFRSVFNKLFKLRPHMAEKLANFTRLAKPTQDTQLVCAHIRIGGHQDEKDPRKPVDEYVQSPKHISVWFDFIQETFIRKLNARKSKYKIFITTDRDFVYSQAIERFGRELVVANQGDFFHIDLIRQRQDCGFVEKTYLDFHSYKYCDMSVIANSQFSKYGHLLMDDYKLEHPVLYMFYTLKFKFYRYDSFDSFESI